MALTFRAAVEKLKNSSRHSLAMYDSYLDCSNVEAAKRYSQSEEYTALLALITSISDSSLSILEVGAGNGFTSLTLARLGHSVTSLDSNPCDLYGIAALRGSEEVSSHLGDVCALPFPDASFDLVLSRQLLHHLPDIAGAAREIARVLKPKGTWIALREHVAESAQELADFLAGHPIHELCNNECAYPLAHYQRQLACAFPDIRTIGPFDSVINHFPVTNRDVQTWCENALRRYLPSSVARMLTCIPAVMRCYRARLSRRCTTPGRMVSFVMRRAA